MIYKQGEIVLIPVPFSDLSSTKRRPVMILSNSEYNKLTDDIIVAAITSNIRGMNREVIFDNEDMEVGAIAGTLWEIKKLDNVAQFND